MYLNILLCILVIFTFILTTSFSEAAENIENLIEKGIMLAESEQNLEALSYFDIVLEKEPSNLRALNAKAVTLGKLERYEEALSYLDRVLEQDPENLLALNSKGITFVMLEQYNEALSYFEKILDVDPDNDKILDNKISTLIKIAETEEDISYIDRVLEISSNHIQALNLKGQFHADRGEYEDAISYFDRVLFLEPQNHKARLNWSNAFNKLPSEEIEGFAKIQVRDQQGRLVAYIVDSDLKIRSHSTAYELIDRFNSTGIITRDGQDFNVFEKRLITVPISEKFLARVFIGDIIHGQRVYPIFTSSMDGFFYQNDDTIIVDWIFLRPA